MSTLGAAARSGRAAPMSAEDRRAWIVRAALPLIRAHGTDVTSKQIAQAAGIAEGTVFRVFPDKDAVIRAAVASVFDAGPTLAALDAIDPTLPLEGRITRIVDILRDRVNSLWELLAALRVFGPSAPGGHRYLPQADPSDTSTLEAIAHVLTPSADQLRIPPDKAARLIRMWAFTGSHPRIAGDNPLTTQEIVSTLLDGIRSRAP